MFADTWPCQLVQIFDKFSLPKGSFQIFRFLWPFEHDVGKKSSLILLKEAKQSTWDFSCFWPFIEQQQQQRYVLPKFSFRKYFLVKIFFFRADCKTILKLHRDCLNSVGILPSYSWFMMCKIIFPNFFLIYSAYFSVVKGNLWNWYVV